MNKSEFINKLELKISGFDQNEINKAISFYSEMIDDRIEDGMDEESAVESLGDINDIAAEIMEQMPLGSLISHKVSKSRNRFQNKGVWLSLVICGFPIWFPLLIAGICIALAIYICIWAVIFSFCAAVFAFAAAGVCSVAAGTVFCFIKDLYVGIALIGMGISSIGLFLITFFPIIELCKKTAIFTRFLFRKIKGLFISKEEAA